MTGVFSSFTPGPLTTRSWPIFPLLSRSGSYGPALRLCEGSAILNSVSVTVTFCGAFGGGAVACFRVVVALVEVACVVEAVEVCVSEVVDAACVVSAAVEPAAAFPSAGSRPKKKTADIIPRKSATLTVRNAGRPRRPGKSGRNAGITNAETSAKTTKASPISPRPTLCPVDSAASSTARNLSKRARCYEAAVSPGRGSRTPVSGGPTGVGASGRRYSHSYATAPATPPTSGPTYQIQAFVQNESTSSGPNARAGFIAAPVSGPPIRMSIVIVRPIASPAIDLNVPRGSAAVAKTTQTMKNVRISSVATPAPEPFVAFNCGTPSFLPSTEAVGKIHFRAVLRSRRRRTARTSRRPRAPASLRVTRKASAPTKMSVRVPTLGDTPTQRIEHGAS